MLSCVSEGKFCGPEDVPIACSGILKAVYFVSVQYAKEYKFYVVAF